MTRSPTHKSHPDPGGGEFDESEVVRVVLYEARGDRPEVLEFAEETFDQISVAVEKDAEGGDVDASRPRDV